MYKKNFDVEFIFQNFENEGNLTNFGYAFISIFHATVKTFPGS